MRILHARPFVVACLAALAASAGSATVYGAAPLQPETLSMQPMPPRGDHFLYALEMSAPIDERLTVYDIDKGPLKTLGFGFRNSPEPLKKLSHFSG